MNLLLNKEILHYLDNYGSKKSKRLKNHYDGISVTQ